MRGSLRTLFAKRTDYGNMLFVSCGCLKHQYHLVVGGQLKLVDHILRTFDTKVRYFSCLATMSHTWRAHLSKMRTKWSEMHHGTRTEQNRNILFKTPPVAIAGRWASIDSSSDDGVILSKSSHLLSSRPSLPLPHPTVVPHGGLGSASRPIVASHRMCCHQSAPLTHRLI